MLLPRPFRPDVQEDVRALQRILYNATVMASWGDAIVLPQELVVDRADRGLYCGATSSGPKGSLPVGVFGLPVHRGRGGIDTAVTREHWA